LLQAARADYLIEAATAGTADLVIEGATLDWEGEAIARLVRGKDLLVPRLELDPSLQSLPDDRRRSVRAALEDWLTRRSAALVPLRKLEVASRESTAGPELRALLIRLVEAGGILPREAAGLELLDPAQRKLLARLGVTVGALDLFVATMLRPAARLAWRDLQGEASADPAPGMPCVIPAGRRAVPAGYRNLAKQALRIDLAERLLREAHGARIAAAGKPFVLDPALPVSMGLTTLSYAQLLRLGGFQPLIARGLRDGEHGPVQPPRWRWRPARRAAPEKPRAAAPRSGAFAGLAALVS
jgi:ATP-dependent RNA helicase SUPV3L1/SUV3